MSRALALAVGLLLALPSAGLAHRSASYYELRWMTSPAGTEALLGDETLLDWAFSPTFQDEARPDALRAVEAWNEHAQSLRFVHVGDIDVDPGMGQCPLGDLVTTPVNAARRGEIDGSGFDGGGILALAVLCPTPVGGFVQHFTVTYDEAEPWHFGAPPVPADRFDLQGILAHEFGHATGWGRHFEDNTGTECVFAVRHTMCSTVWPGTDDPRTLEEHDIDTWEDAY